VLLDYDLVNAFKANDRNAATRGGCYEHGDAQDVHGAMPQDTWLIPRTGRSGDDSCESSGHMQRGIVAVNGYYWAGHNSHDEMENSFAWGGINKTEQRITNPNDRNHSEATNQGSTSHVVGKETIPWRSYRPCRAGDLVCWGLPMSPLHPSSSDQRGQLMYVPGTEPLQNGVVYNTYRPRDLSCQLAAAHSAISMPKGANGIADMTYADTLPHMATVGSDRAWSGTQESAAALKYGLAGVGLVFLQALVRNNLVNINVGAGGTAAEQVSALADRLGLWGPAGPSQELQDAMADMLLRNMVPGDPARTAAQDRYEAESAGGGGAGGARGGSRLYNMSMSTPDATDPGAQYDHLRANLMETLLGGLASAMENKRDKVVGMALDDAQPGDDVPILFGFHCK